jgi:uncharacterized damage-inducible protein DinB
MPDTTPTRVSPPLTTALARGPGASFFELSARFLEEYEAKIAIALAELPPERLWWRPAPGTNSAGNLVLHLCGNLTLWLLSGVGGEPFARDRAGEFAAADGPGAGELAARLGGVVARSASLLRRLEAADAARPLTVQGYPLGVQAAVFHAVEHMSYHTGQILYLLKQSLPAGRRIELYPQHGGE